MSYYQYYRQQPNFGTSSYFPGLPSQPTFRPQAAWGGPQFFRAQAGLPLDDYDDRGLFDSAWGGGRFGMSDAVPAEEAQYWHRRVYGGMAPVRTLSPLELGAAAGFEAFRQWSAYGSTYRSPLGNSGSRFKEALAGIAAGEVTQLLGTAMLGRSLLREAARIAVATAQSLSLEETGGGLGGYGGIGSRYGAGAGLGGPMMGGMGGGGPYGPDGGYGGRGFAGGLGRPRFRRSSFSFGENDDFLPGGGGVGGPMGPYSSPMPGGGYRVPPMIGAEGGYPGGPGGGAPYVGGGLGRPRRPRYRRSSFSDYENEIAADAADTAINNPITPALTGRMITAGTPSPVMAQATGVTTIPQVQYAVAPQPAQQMMAAQPGATMAGGVSQSYTIAGGGVGGQGTTTVIPPPGGGASAYTIPAGGYAGAPTVRYVQAGAAGTAGVAGAGGVAGGYGQAAYTAGAVGGNPGGRLNGLVGERVRQRAAVA